MLQWSTIRKGVRLNGFTDLLKLRSTNKIREHYDINVSMVSLKAIKEHRVSPSSINGALLMRTMEALTEWRVIDSYILPVSGWTVPISHCSCKGFLKRSTLLPCYYRQDRLTMWGRTSFCYNVIPLLYLRLSNANGLRKRSLYTNGKEKTSRRVTSADGMIPFLGVKQNGVIVG